MSTAKETGMSVRVVARSPDNSSPLPYHGAGLINFLGRPVNETSLELGVNSHAHRTHRADWYIFQMLYLIGLAEGYTRDVESIARDLGLKDFAIVGTKSYNRPFLASEHNLSRSGEYIACLSPPGLRWKTVESMRDIGLATRAPLLHPDSSIDTEAKIGEGTTVNRLAAIGSRVEIGMHCHINRLASVGHHTTLEDFVNIGPGATIASSATLQKGCFVGAGAVVLPEIAIGRNAVIGAGAVVTRPVPDFATVVGNPARVTKVSESGYKGFTVLD